MNANFQMRWAEAAHLGEGPESLSQAVLRMLGDAEALLRTPLRAIPLPVPPRIAPLTADELCAVLKSRAG